jgi:hypothetical protein
MRIGTAWLVLLLLPLATASSREAGPWRISNPSLRVTLSDDGALSIVERSSGQRWDSTLPPESSARVTAVTVEDQGRALESRIELDGVAFHLRLALDDASPQFDLSLAAPAQAPLQHEVGYPWPLRAPGPEYRMVLPHQTGLVYTVQDAASDRKFTARFPCFGGGLAMPWFGVTDLERGLMILIETPGDVYADPQLEASDARQVFALGVGWLPSRGTVGYTRKLRYRLFDHEGYVAMCKYYRQQLIQSGQFVTLRQKQKELPQLSKLIGAIDLHMWRAGDQEQKEVVEYLESKGVRRLFIHSDASAKTLAWMRDHGDLVGTYRIYTDILPPRPGLPEALTRGYPQDAYTRQNGLPVRGFAFSPTHRSTYRCSLRQLPLMKELLPPLVRKKGYQAIFLDVLTAEPLRDCYAPAHPLDRLLDEQTRIKILRFADSLGLVVGSENGIYWAAPYVEYFEGMSMPSRFGYIPGTTVNNWPKKIQLTDEYKDVDLNERVRAPLWDLVFHDSVVSTWRWNFTPDRYPQKKWWDRQDLLYMIAGDMPIFLVNQQWLKRNGDRLAQTYRNACEWDRKIGYDELVDHRALTADRTVQQSRFSSGWEITVNFSQQKTYTAPDGTVLKPASYRIGRVPAAPNAVIAPITSASPIRMTPSPTCRRSRRASGGLGSAQFRKPQAQTAFS